MFRFGQLQLPLKHLPQKLVAYCESEAVASTAGEASSIESGDGDESVIMQEADRLADLEKQKIKIPGQFNTLKHVIGQNSVNIYDGFRLIVQKQVNLNTVVSHFYWIGSQALQQPMYQYRIILPYDDRVLHVATDADANLEGDFKTPMWENTSAQCKFVLSDQRKSLDINFERVDDSSASMLQYVAEEENAVVVEHMQAITPALSLGGMGSYVPKTKQFSTAVGGIYDTGDNVVAAQWDQELNIMYMRRVNPNRVHLSSNLAIGRDGTSLSTLAAEYTLKQSKINMSVDSNLEIKSALETMLAAGVQLQFSADFAHLKNQYRFGYGLVMG